MTEIFDLIPQKLQRAQLDDQSYGAIFDYKEKGKAPENRSKIICRYGCLQSILTDRGANVILFQIQ